MVLPLFILSVLVPGFVCQGYQLPPVEMQALRPRGLRVALADDGFSRVIFRGGLNRENFGNSQRWFGIVKEPIEGKWVYRDVTTDPELGDVIYYTLYVTKDGKIYTEDGEYTLSFYWGEHSYGLHKIAPPLINAPCEVSTTMVEVYPYVCKDQLIFSEDFSKVSLFDLREWTVENGFTDQPDYAFNVYQPDAIEMKAGSLVITPTALDEINDDLYFGGRCNGRSRSKQCNQFTSAALIVPPIITGKITTKNSFNFVYGRIEISAKLPSGDWLIPELILEPSHSVYGPENYASGLIRIAYTRGSPTSYKKLYGGPVLSDMEPYRSYFLRETVGTEEWYKNFHNYTLTWKPDGIEIYVDGEQYGYIKPGFSVSGKEYEVQHAEQWERQSSWHEQGPFTSMMAPLNTYFYVSLGLRVGGVNDFPDSPEKPWKNRSTKAILEFWNNRTTWLPSWTDANLLVDYIRIYAL